MKSWLFWNIDCALSGGFILSYVLSKAEPIIERLQLEFVYYSSCKCTIYYTEGEVEISSNGKNFENTLDRDNRFYLIQWLDFQRNISWDEKHKTVINLLDDI